MIRRVPERPADATCGDSSTPNRSTRMREKLDRVEARPSGMVTCLVSGLLLLPVAAPAQAQATGVVVGQVTDDRFGRAIEAVAVEIEGTRLRAVTDAEGRYVIADVPAGNRAVVARHIGYGLVRRTVAVPAGGRAQADFVMQTAPIALDEVVVTGAAGGARLRTIGNSVATINAAEVQALSPTPELTSLLLARAPGLRINQSTGRLGASPTINIRGQGGAIIYIDGVRVNTSTGLGAAGGGLGQQGSSVGGRLNDINPEDIESIEIIKGPAAATIYGTQAMSGVIQIITKRGALGQGPQFNLRTQYGSVFFRDAENRVPTNLMRDAAGNVVEWNAVRQERELGNPLFRRGHVRNVHGSVSGGTEAFRYRASALVEDTEGVEPNNFGRNFGLQTNLDVAVSPRFNLASTINFTELDSHLGTDTGLSALLGAMVGHSLLQPTRRGFGLGYPPEISWELYDNTAKVSRFTASGTGTFIMTDWLRHRVLLGIDHTSGDHRTLERFAPDHLAVYLTPAQAAGRIGQTLRLNRNITLDYGATANTSVTRTLASYLSAGLQVLRTEASISNLGGQGFPGPGVTSITATATKLNSTQSDMVNTTLGMYVQEKLGWNDRLFLTGALRIDNNSAFGERLSWVTYPKADITWVLSEEPFWRDFGFLNTLRLRAAYGESGRAPATFAALRTFNSVQGPGGTNAVTPGSQGNPDLRPERGKEWEVGFEAALLDRLTLDVTYFHRNQVDLIQNVGVAPSGGFPGSIPMNLGEVESYGFEVQAGLRAVQRSNFAWRIDANVSADESWVISMGDILEGDVAPGEGIRADHPRGAIFTRRVVAAELNPATGRAINVLCDGGPANDHAPMPCPQAPTVHIGQNRPKYSGAVSNTFSLGSRVSIYALTDFKSKHLRFSNDEALRCTGAVGAGLCEINIYPERFSPLLVAQTVGTAQGLLEMYWMNAAFVKLRELAVTYRVPERLLPMGERASVTLSGRELATWTSFGGLDPENSGQAVMPPLTRLTATFNIGF
jgi:TonB-linked SusC/RagA family outer membrane protein